MADWTRPTPVSNYIDFVDEVRQRDIDSASLFKVDPSNISSGFVRYSRTLNRFQEWNGTIWVDLILSVAGGGTGTTTPGGIFALLGLGTMSQQNSNNVNISGGVLAGAGSGLYGLNAANLSGGTVPLARLGTGTPNTNTFLRGDNTWAVVVVDIPYAVGDANATFNAYVNTFFNLGTPAANVLMPTVVGNMGKIIGLIKRANNTWVVNTQPGETILGQNPYFFDWPQYSSLVLKADANGNKWDVI